MAPGKGQEVCEGQHGAEHYSRTSCLLWLHRHLPHLWDPELNVKNGCKAKTRERTHVWTEERLERESVQREVQKGGHLSETACFLTPQPVW